MTSVIGLIPARYGSTRLPAKSLLPIDGLPLIIHTYKRAKLAQKLDDIYVCTDHEEIASCVKSYGGKYIITSSNHPTGTDRIAEAVRKKKLRGDLFIDIQGDEPLISPYDIDKVIDYHLENSKFDIILPCLKIDLPVSPHIVKVVRDKQMKVLYLTRSIVPYPFANSPSHYLKHLSIVSFKPSILEQFGRLPQSSLELIESIELLRALENGMSVGTLELDGDSFSIDIQADYERVKEQMLYDEFRKQY